MPPPVIVVAGLVAGVTGLVAIGFLQWLELRVHVRRSAAWIGWTALAWMLALPLSFLPGPFVDERTPLPVHFVAWGTGGLAMAFVMALVTWQGARRLATAP